MAAGPTRHGSMIASINVTPLVDVMMVLLVVFMITAPMMMKQPKLRQKVGIDLPRTDAKTVNLDEDQKIVLTIQQDLKVLIGDVEIADCGGERDLPYMKEEGGCLSQIEEKLVGNVKLQQDRELYLLADRRIPYGVVVSTMARIKKAGVEKLGMVTDPPGGLPPEADAAPVK